MRIIHTSDWHLGQNFYTKSRAAEHQAFLDWLLAQAEHHQADAIIVAGDIFDTGSPPSYARELYNRFVVRLQQTGCALYILAGNHDSVATLNESRELLACLNTCVVATPTDEPLEIISRDGTPGAILCPIPFLRPRDLLQSQAGQDGRDKQLSLLEAISQHYQHVHEKALALRGQRDLPIIATGHLTAVGVTTSDSVRDIYIGSLDAFPAQNFPPADYIALGHIHRPQSVGGMAHVRYSGSPIALSFDETGKEKSVSLVSFEDAALTEIKALPVPVTQPLALIKGSLAEIEQQLSIWRDAPEQPVTWLDIEVTTDEYLHDMQRHIRQLTEDLPLEVILIRRSREQRQRAIDNQHKETLSELSVDDVFSRRLAQEGLEPEREARLRLLFGQIQEALHQEDEA
ncbi:exonuclease subunit SbcD [Enterobacteriaceae bacterium BIT-l23]|uniref:Nuclease SbcCD subunit D n=1 Tax=Jejubacter calystegiae TaxID=2579935 RepID=A0A4P8YHM8_9ENTR|nr:exonuclease subunit SbcD [Jejubacter calystegiae]NUU64595.1 exonuclease subunit SbcD [Enterobacteriaceae bacterium BIT-l23]QCT20100.1 exonuclease subunit SbcD [Jejubacter calystegiae]